MLKLLIEIWFAAHESLNSRPTSKPTVRVKGIWSKSVSWDQFYRVFQMWFVSWHASKGVTRGARGDRIPRAPNRYGSAKPLRGRRMTAEGAEKSQQYHKYTIQYSTFADFRFEHGGVKLASCPGRHLNSLRPCTQVRSLHCCWQATLKKTFSRTFHYFRFCLKQSISLN